MKKYLISFAFLISFGFATAQLDSSWYHTFEKVNWEELAYDVIPGVDGGYLIAGTLYHSFYKDEEDYDAYFLKIDENGNKEWSEYYGGPGHDFIYSVVITDDSNYMAFGHTWKEMIGEMHG